MKPEHLRKPAGPVKYWLALTAIEQQRFMRATLILSHTLDKAQTYRTIQEKFRELLAGIPNLRGILAGTPDEVRVFVVARWVVTGISLELVLADGAIELEIAQVGTDGPSVIVQVLPALRQLEPLSFVGSLEEACELLERAAKTQDVGVIDSLDSEKKED